MLRLVFESGQTEKFLVHHRRAHPEFWTVDLADEASRLGTIVGAHLDDETACKAELAAWKMAMLGICDEILESAAKRDERFECHCLQAGAVNSVGTVVLALFFGVIGSGVHYAIRKVCGWKPCLAEARAAKAELQTILNRLVL